jgi:hypothetical protein
VQSASRSGSSSSPSATASRLATPSPTPVLSPRPQATSSVAFDRRGEGRLVGDLIGALLADAEEFGDLNETDARGTL